MLKSLCAELVFHQPEDPKAFMIESLKKMKKDGVEAKKGLLTDDELATLFSMVDPTEKQILDKNQVSITSVLHLPGPHQCVSFSQFAGGKCSCRTSPVAKCRNRR